MEINKYFIGQEVYFLYNGKVENAKVRSIHSNEIYIYYYTTKYSCSFREDEIYLTEKEPFDNLIAKKQAEIEKLEKLRDKE